MARSIPTHKKGQKAGQTEHVEAGLNRMNPTVKKGRGLPKHQSAKVGAVEDVGSGKRFRPSG